MCRKRHSTRHKVCTKTLYKTKSLYNDTVQDKKLVQRLCTRQNCSTYKTVPNKELLTVEGGGDMKIRG